MNYNSFYSQTESGDMKSKWVFHHSKTYLTLVDNVTSILVIIGSPSITEILNVNQITSSLITLEYAIDFPFYNGGVVWSVSWTDTDVDESKLRWDRDYCNPMRGCIT